MRYKQQNCRRGREATRTVVEESGRDGTDVLFLQEVYIYGGVIEGVEKVFRRKRVMK